MNHAISVHFFYPTNPKTRTKGGRTNLKIGCELSKPEVLFPYQFQSSVIPQEQRVNEFTEQLTIADAVLNSPKCKQSIFVTEFCDTLNEEQKAAVKAGVGPIGVTAGPGTGKTRTLIGRIAYLVNDLGIKKSRIGAFTFTNKAAKQMKERLQNKLLTGNMKELFVGTFHSLCLKILRSAKQYQTIIDEDDQLKMLKVIIVEQGMQAKAAYSILSMYSYLRNTSSSREEIQQKLNEHHDKKFVQIVEIYQQEKFVHKEVDFDDLLFNAINILQHKPQIRKEWQDRFQHILVDEFQDTNKAQFQLIRLLTKIGTDNNNVFVVGDKNQSIYGFRGSHPNVFEDFNSMFPQMKQFDLLSNYRSKQYIINAADTLNNLSDNQVPGELQQVCIRAEEMKQQRNGNGFQQNENEQEILFKKRAQSLEEEAKHILQYVKERLDAQTLPEEIVVLYRYHRYGDLVAKLLRKNGIKVYQHGTFDLWRRKEVKFLRYILQLSVNYQSSGLNGVYQHVTNGFGERSYKKLQEYQKQMGSTINEVLFGDIYDMEIPGDVLSEVLSKIIEYSTQRNEKQVQLWKSLRDEVIEVLPEFCMPTNAPQLRKKQIRGILELRAFYVILRNMLKVCDVGSLEYIFLFIFESIEYFQTTKDTTKRQSRMYLMEALRIGLNDAWQQFQESEQIGQGQMQDAVFEVLEILERQLQGEMDTAVKSSQRVNLMTIHASKGLEFSDVVICGLNQNQFPKKDLSQCEDDNDRMEYMEEVRLMYVAITRAKNGLLMTCSVKGDPNKFRSQTEQMPSVLYKSVRTFQEYILREENSDL